MWNEWKEQTQSVRMQYSDMTIERDLACLVSDLQDDKCSDIDAGMSMSILSFGH